MNNFSRYVVQAAIKKSLTKAGWEWEVRRSDKEHPKAAPLIMAQGELKSPVEAAMQAKESAKFMATQHGFELNPVLIRPLKPSEKAAHPEA